MLRTSHYRRIFELGVLSILLHTKCRRGLKVSYEEYLFERFFISEKTSYLPIFKSTKASDYGKSLQKDSG